MRDEASKPHPDEDAVVIGQAAIRALDSALMQLSAVWGAEQQRDEIMRKQAEALKAAQKRK